MPSVEIACASDCAGCNRSSSVFGLGSLVVDPARRRARVGARWVRLSPSQFRLLSYLAAHANAFHPFADLLRAVFGPDARDCLAERIRLRTVIARTRALLPKRSDVPAIESAFDYGYGLMLLEAVEVAA